MTFFHKPSIRHPLIAFLVFLILIYTTGCASYYRVKQTNPVELSQSKHYKKHRDEKRIFIHEGDRIKQLDSIDIKGALIFGSIVSEYKAVRPFIQDPKSQTKGKVKKEDKDKVHEIHIYLKPTASIEDYGAVQLNTQQIDNVYLVYYSSSTKTYIVLGSFILVINIVAILAGYESPGGSSGISLPSCPSMYSYDGQNYVFEGELYSSSFLQNLENHDYLHLSALQSKNNFYFIRVANEHQEIQYTNQVELIVVNHPISSKVVTDKNGNLISITSESHPLRALSHKQIDQVALLKESDNSVFSFNELKGDTQSLSLTFDKPAGAQKATLLLTGKNTIWRDYVLHEYYKKFGKEFNKWMRQTGKMNVEARIEGIKKKQLDLSVYLKNGQSWQLIDVFLMVGPLGDRELILPLDLTSHQEKEIEIKLKSGFSFWELNKASIDFSRGEELNVFRLQPSIPEPINHNTVIAMVKDDNTYLKMNPGDVIDLRFQEIDVPDGMTQSIFLHSKGHYKLLRQFKGKPDTQGIEKLNQPGQFSRFSKSLYEEYLRSYSVETPTIPRSNLLNKAKSDVQEY